jgi:hypothetical protein
MSIWDRIARVARSELSEMKRVLSEKDEGGGAADGRPETPEEARRRAIREAEEELERAERDVLAAQFEMGSAGWSDGRIVADPVTSTDPDLARGASMWGAAAPVANAGPVVTAGWHTTGPGQVVSTAKNPTIAPAVETGGAGPAVVEVAKPEVVAAKPDAQPKTADSRTREIPRDVREAYAALELPLGAGADTVRASHATLVARFHPDRFGTDPDRERIAQMVKTRIDAARDVIVAWLGG